MFTDDAGEPRTGRVVAACLAALLAVVVTLVGAAAGCREYSRYQKRAEAENEVKVTRIEIQKAEEQAKVVRAQIEATRAAAEKKFVESTGIRRAQDEIQQTLTPLYVQHESVQAQLKMANSPNNTIIWAPAGNNGVPVVTDPLANAFEGRSP